MSDPVSCPRCNTINRGGTSCFVCTAPLQSAPPAPSTPQRRSTPARPSQGTSQPFNWGNNQPSNAPVPAATASPGSSTPVRSRQFDGQIQSVGHETTIPINDYMTRVLKYVVLMVVVLSFMSSLWVGLTSNLFLLLILGGIAFLALKYLGGFIRMIFKGIFAAAVLAPRDRSESSYAIVPIRIARADGTVVEARVTSEAEALNLRQGDHVTVTGWWNRASNVFHVRRLSDQTTGATHRFGEPWRVTINRVSSVIVGVGLVAGAVWYFTEGR